MVKTGISTERTVWDLRLPQILLWLAMAGYAGIFAYLTIVRYAAFEARALDMGNLDQAIWNTAHGRWFHFTNQPGAINRLSLHVEPILIPISLLYWIRSGPPTLLLLQAVVVALGAAPVFALAKHKLHAPWPALLLAVAYLLNPALQAANWLEFHPITLAPTFLLAAFYFLVTGSDLRANGRPCSTQDRLYTVAVILAASCKEEVGLLVAMIGLYALLILRRPRLGILTFVFGLSWSLLAVLVIQNYFAAGNIHWDRYAYLGDNPGQMVRSLFTRPGLLLAQLQAAQSLSYLRQLLLPAGFMALLAPEILLLALPSLAINLLADFAPMHQVYTLIYAAPIVPFVWLATLYSVTRIRRWAFGHARIPIAVATWIPVLLVCTGALWAQWQVGYLPGGGNYHHYTITEHDRRAAAIIDQIPPDAVVSAHDRLIPHVSSREKVYIFPRIEDADTIFLDVTGPAWPQHPNDLFTTVQSLRAEGWRVAAADHGYLLLRHTQAHGMAAPTPDATGKPGTEPVTASVATPAAAPLPDSFYDVWRVSDYQPETPLKIDFADTLRLLDYRVLTDEHGELVVRLYWQLLQPIEPNTQRVPVPPIRFYLAYADRSGANLYDTLFYQPVAVLWYPTSMWTPGTTVVVETLPWSLDQAQFSLLLGLFFGDGAWEADERLPITQTDPPRPTLQNNSVVRLGGYRRAGTEWIAIQPSTVAPEKRYALQFGDHILFDGVTIDSGGLMPGADLTFTTFWHTDAAIDFDYTIFAHLLDASGAKVAQLDWQPADSIGPLPFTAWLPGQSVADQQTLALPAGLAPGDYRLVAGVYNWQSGERLSIQPAGKDATGQAENKMAEIENNTVILAQFTVTE